MPRTCTVCTHGERLAIDQALVDGQSFRTIAHQWCVSLDALKRHKRDHLPQSLVRAKDAEQVAQADDLLGRIEELQRKTLSILAAAESKGDHNLALRAIGEARRNLELLAELTQQLDRRPQVNILLSTEWLTVRSTLLAALHPYPEARAAVAERLLELEFSNENR